MPSSPVQVLGRQRRNDQDAGEDAEGNRRRGRAQASLANPLAIAPPR